jgi:hypothetical protein
VTKKDQIYPSTFKILFKYRAGSPGFNTKKRAAGNPTARLQTIFLVKIT